MTSTLMAPLVTILTASWSSKERSFPALTDTNITLSLPGVVLPDSRQLVRKLADAPIAFTGGLIACSAFQQAISRARRNSAEPESTGCHHNLPVRCASGHKA